MKMLILEDDAEVRKLVIEFLKEAVTEIPLEIYWAETMLGAYSLNAVHAFDCQIVDIRVQDGLSWSYIEKTKDCIRTLATSAHAFQIREDLNGVRFLPKPYSMIEFMRELSYLMGEETKSIDFDFPDLNCSSLHLHKK